MEKAISIKHLSVGYGKRQVLKDVSFEVRGGHIHGLLGPNGAGKTTTMKSIIGLVSPSFGEIFIQGKNQIKNKQHRFSVGFLLESPPLYEDLSVTEYLKYVGQLQGLKPSELEQRLREIIKLFDIESIMHRRVGNLSKGYKQRLGMAQAIIHSPDIVILDEPTLGLDPHTVIEIRNLILKLKEHHTVLISSHQLHEMSLICDEISILVDGCLIESGTIKSITNKLSGMRQIELEVLDKFSNLFCEAVLKKKWIKTYEILDLALGQKMIITPNGPFEFRPELMKLAVDFGLKILGLSEKIVSLEDLFLNITGDK